MNEKNRKTLQDALNRMKQYQADDEIWDQLEDRLEQPASSEENRKSLNQAINDLPRYQAPIWLWSKLEQRLDRSTKWAKSRPWIAAAAVVTILLLGTWTAIPSGEVPGELPSPRASERSAPAAPQLVPAQSLNQGEDLKECLLYPKLWSREKRQAWREIEALHKQLESTSEQGESLAQAYQEKLAVFQARFCD